MLRIEIPETAPDADSMADLLDHIAHLIREGMTSGYYPHWTMHGEEERPDDPT